MGEPGALHITTLSVPKIFYYVFRHISEFPTAILYIYITHIVQYHNMCYLNLFLKTYFNKQKKN